MTTADENTRLREAFLGLAGQVERLITEDPTRHPEAKSQLITRWQTLYAPEAATVLKWRASIIDPPSHASSADLEEWTAFARKLLKEDPTAA